MKGKWLLHKLFIIFISLSVLFLLAGCSGKEQGKEPGFASTKISSSSELFNLYVPAGWSTEEIIPGADLVMANNEAALGRFTNGSALESGDVVLNVGFLPMALLKEKELSHLGFHFEAQPDVFLQSLLPMFRFGEVSAGSVAGEVTLVSLGDGRGAGMLTFLEEGREGLLLVFSAGEDVFSFVSATTYPGGLQEYQGTILEIAAGVAYTGSQDALYSKLYGD